MGEASSGNVNSIINLNGGTLSSNQFQRNTTGTSTGNSTFHFNGGTLRALSSNSSWFNNIGTTGNFVLTVLIGGAVIDSNGFDVTINQALANGGGGGGLTKNGAGTLTLNGSNTYTGATTVNAGTLAIGASDRIADTSNLNVVGGTFNLNNFNEALGSITGSGNITLGSGTLTTNSSSNTTFSGVVSGAGGAIVKNGAGALTLTGDNTYTGATTINAGTLIVNGNNTAATGAVAVASGATLGGNGRIGGATTVNGNLQPGSNGPGVLTFSSSLTLSSTANLTMEINGTGARGTAYDGIDVTGALTYGGNLTMAIGSPFADGNYTFTLFGSSSSNSGSFASVSLSGAYSGSLTESGGVWSLASEGNTWTFYQSTGFLAVSAVPEPSTYALLLFGLASVIFARRRLRGRRAVASITPPHGAAFSRASLHS
jgi:autotransporter-associated beta strand protein